MKDKLSPRLVGIIDALPIQPGIRVLEIGCGTGGAAREICRRTGDGYVLGIDRSAKAITQAVKSTAAMLEAGKLSFKQIAIENFEYPPSEKKFDLAVAIRVGALDGRHPELAQQAKANIAKALTNNGKLFIDDGATVKEIPLSRESNSR